MANNRPLFDRSFAALALVNARGAAAPASTARILGVGHRLRGGNATAMSIRFAPEPDPTANVIELGEDQTTGPLPVDFEFEFFGVRYSWFDLSSDGFMTFGTESSLCGSDSHPGDRFIPVNDELSNFIALGLSHEYPLCRKRVAYEVRGAVHRRRLVLSFAALTGAAWIGVRRMAAQLVLYERTGMVDVHTTSEDTAAPQVNEAAVRFTTSPGERRCRRLTAAPAEGYWKGT